jgi:four helix bundle protein
MMELGQLTEIKSFMPRHNFRNLKIWQDGIDLILHIYEMTGKFPASEKFNLISQLNRCAVSNIAEGSAKSSDKHFVIYLENSLGSANEWETQFEVAFRLSYVRQSVYNVLIEQIKSLQRSIAKFIETLK